jgi:hypothetical protein
METMIPINYAPNTIIVADNKVNYLNIGGSGMNVYIYNNKGVVVQKIKALSEKEKELVISKLN